MKNKQKNQSPGDTS